MKEFASLIYSRGVFVLNKDILCPCYHDSTVDGGGNYIRGEDSA